MWRRASPLRCFRVPFAIALLLAPVPMSVAHAEDARSCESFWFSRNLIFHRAGYCFKSNLGRGIFGNDDCRAAGPNLSATDKQVIAGLKSAEQEWGCRVDTSRNRMTIPGAALLEKLERQPIPDSAESGCINYLDAPMALRAAPRRDAAVVGTIRRGANVTNGHFGVGGWTVYSATLADGRFLLGWTDVDVFTRRCEGFAG